MSGGRGSAALGLALLGLACSREPVPVAFDLTLAEIHEAPAMDRPVMLFDTPHGLLLSGLVGDEELLWSSADRGASWSVLGALPARPRILAVHDGCERLHRVESDRGVLYHGLGIDALAPRSPVTEPGEIELYAFAVDRQGRLGALWIDRDRGWPELLFGQSTDHGESWSPAVRVNGESRRKEIASPRLLARRDAWVVVWTENRDPRTLFDLYASTSRDGRRWTASRRLNGDREPSFSVHPMAIADGSDVHVVSEDYRETNRFGDRDANVYHTRFAPEEAGASSEARVNDVADAPQTRPTVARDERSGALVVAWQDLRDRLTGDIQAATSGDGGRSWSTNRRINANLRPELSSPPRLAVCRGGGVYVLWRQTHGAHARTLLRRVEAVAAASGEKGETTAPPRDPAPPAAPPLPPASLAAVERFDGGGLGALRPLSGSWIVHEGALLGFEHGMALAEWTPGGPIQDFILEGRFRLDRRQHLGAHVFLRMQPSPGGGRAFEGFHLRSHFRRGISLSRARFTLPPEGPPTLVVEPLTDRWYPVLQDRWYDFRIAVAGRRLDYWLDGIWMLSSDAVDPRAGAIVIGADDLAPVAWDDLRLYTVDSSQTASSR